MVCARSKHTLPELGYDYSALEPIICREIMELHHSKHHQTYVTNFNAAEAQLADALSKNDTSKVISLQNALRFNGGGHLNHAIFWKNLSPAKTERSKELNDALATAFGSFENFKKDLVTQTVAVQGSGWGWLGYNRKNGQLQIATCANQDPLEASTGNKLSQFTNLIDFNSTLFCLGLVPLLGIDVWEHAYYIQYKNVRPSYVEAIFDIVNWKDVSERLAAAKSK